MIFGAAAKLSDPDCGLELIHSFRINKVQVDAFRFRIPGPLKANLSALVSDFRRLIIPQEMQMDSLSYPPDFSNTKAGKTIYYYHKEMFMPDREFEIYFRR